MVYLSKHGSWFSHFLLWVLKLKNKLTALLPSGGISEHSKIQILHKSCLIVYYSEVEFVSILTLIYQEV